MKKLSLALAFALLSTASFGSEAEKGLIERWYAALGSVNRAEFQEILSDKAKITLGDLDIVQTKAEFITSLDEWQDAMKGAAIRHAIDSDADGLVTVSVCYKFPDNEALGREVFAIDGGKIVSSEQETIAESCESFPG